MHSRVTRTLVCKALQLLRQRFQRFPSAAGGGSNASLFETVEADYCTCPLSALRRHGQKSAAISGKLELGTLRTYSKCSLPLYFKYAIGCEHAGRPKRSFSSSSGESQKSSQGSVNFAETAKFAAMAETWWDMNGPFKPLHMMNPVRLSFIRSALCQHFRRNPRSPTPLEGLSVVDVGCGGGLLCEPLARMGATVTGIDAVEKNIQVASAHCIKDPMTTTIQYFCTTAEQLVLEQQQFDVVIALEVIEHVEEPKDFVNSLHELTKNEGAVLISTINRSIRSYLLAIIAAEYILSLLPKGTHEWSKFITPEELSLLMTHTGLSLQEMAGMVYNPLTGKWALSEDMNINYIAFGTKPF